MTDPIAHRPVLMHETIDLLAPQPGATVVDGTLGAGTDGQHGDHRSHTDDNAEHGEERSQGVGPDRPEGQRGRLAEAHGFGFAVRRPGSPPPMTRRIRSRTFCWDRTRLALGSSRTESVSESPARTSL